MLTIWFGRRGSGKTTSIRATIPEMKKPVIVLDVLGNYTGYQSNGKDWIDVDNATSALIALRNYIEKPDENSGIIVIQTGNIDTAMDFMCSALWKIHGGTLVCDEGDAITISDSPCFDEAIRYGRNHGIDMVFGCRRPAEITKNVTAGADIIYIFNTHEPRDIEYYCDLLGDTLAYRIAALPPHYGVYRDFTEQKDGDFFADPTGKIHIKSSVPSYQEQTKPVKSTSQNKEKVNNNLTDDNSKEYPEVINGR